MNVVSLSLNNWFDNQDGYQQVDRVYSTDMTDKQKIHIQGGSGLDGGGRVGMDGGGAGLDAGEWGWMGR